MTRSDATDLVWNSATPVLGFLGFIAVLLLSLALIGLVSRW